MLFYTQIKREFSHATWRRGQNYFREKRVKDVRLDGDTVHGKVQGKGGAAYETSITMARGTIFNSKCSCPAHRQYEAHCKHVSALSIWVVERGSLLRAGVANSELGVKTQQKSRPGAAPTDGSLMLRNPQRAFNDRRLRKLLQIQPELSVSSFILRKDLNAGFVTGTTPDGKPFSFPVTLQEAQALAQHAKGGESGKTSTESLFAEAVIFVRGVFRNSALIAISIEPAARYEDPSSKRIEVVAVDQMVKQMQPGVWRTITGHFLRVVEVEGPLPIVQGINGAKVIFHGKEALENLARLATGRDRARVVLHASLEVILEPEPLKLSSLHIGAKKDNGRSLSYEFSAGDVKFSQDDLSALESEGRLSENFLWQGNKLYQLETSLTQLSQYTNKTGIAEPEGHKDLQDSEEYPLHPITAYRLSLELGVADLSVDQDWEEFHEWKKTFEKKKIPSLPKADYGFELREYQKNGLSWLWSLYHRGLAALLADDMGLGKTHQVLAFLTSLYTAAKKPKEPSLVIAPTSVVFSWAQKLAKYDTRLNWVIFHGKSRKLPAKGVDVVLTTYGILQREAVLREKQWHCVILDEAQAIKNQATLSSRASRVIPSKFKIAMTGTPVENQSTDLWSIMEFLLPGYLGSLPRFKRIYGSGRDGPSALQAAALRRLVSPFMLRRTKSQVLTELPEKTEEVVACEMTAVQRRRYRAYLESAEAIKARQALEGAGKVNYANILSLLTRLKQVCDHPRLPEYATNKKIEILEPKDSGKWVAFEELVTEALGSNLKIVVFTQYMGVMDMIGHYLKGKGVGFTELRGDTSDRAARLEKFQTDPECKIFLCSLLAGGLGIDLTAGSVCIHYDRWWNPAKENQATDRLHRIGQTRGVQVFKLQIPGSVEDRIASIIASKVSLSGALIEESSLGLKSFSRKELLDLLTPAEDDSPSLFDPGDSGTGDGVKGDGDGDEDLGDIEEYTNHSGVRF